MGFKKIKARVKNCRGAGPEFILKQFEDNFDNWESGIGDLNDEEKQEIADKFNAIIEDFGDSLIEDKATFLCAKADLKSEDITKFTNALCPEYFEVTEDEE